MILDTVTDQPAAGFELGHFLWRDKGRVGRAQLILDGDRLGCGDQRLGLVAEQAAPRNGRERNCHLELVIIVAPGALPRLRPAMIEDIFALAVGLQIGRGGGGETAVGIVDQDRGRHPAAVPADAVALLEQGEEGAGHERIGGGKAVPCLDRADRRAEPGEDFGVTVGHLLPR